MKTITPEIKAALTVLEEHSDALADCVHLCLAAEDVDTLESWLCSAANDSRDAKVQALKIENMLNAQERML